MKSIKIIKNYLTINYSKKKLLKEIIHFWILTFCFSNNNKSFVKFIMVFRRS